ncbi:hypothetical protein B7494_g3756 [Chlorociboria aeruginascens]|nr:hypothetical protein B7494_g3756 [Chlorociboria aeruginascens]
MSSEAIPISPQQFATALKDLPLSTLHLKAIELRNSIAHLDYSNEQLKPFAEGTQEGNPEPDQDCVDAIRENEVVIQRMLERIGLLKAELESRGSSWLELQSSEERKKEDGLVNGDTDGHIEEQGEASEAWRDGTFQIGRISNGRVRMDRDSGVNGTGTGGRLDDEALRRAMGDRMRVDEGDDENGMHL